MVSPRPKPSRSVRRAAVVASIAVHAVALWGLGQGGRGRPPRQPPIFAVDLAPAPRLATELAPEVEPAPAPPPTPATVEPAEGPPPAPPPPVAGVGLADAGMADAEVVDAGPPPDARRRRPDAGLDGGDDGGLDGGDDGGLDAPLVAAVDDGGPGDDGALVAATVDDGGARDAGGAVATATGPVGDGGVGGAGTDDGGTVVAGGADPTGSRAARPSTGAGADLRRFFPHGHQVSVLVRLDRLRDTEWAPRVDAIFGPMPDYQSLVGDSGVKLTETFETLAISTPRPRDATATTLVVRGRATPAALRDLVDAPDAPVAWTAVAGGALGRRAPSPRVFAGDRRVFLQWKLGWTALAQPADLGGLLAPRAGPLDVEAPLAALPAWLDQVALIEAEAGEPTGPVVMATAAGVFPARLPIPYGSGGDLPGPDRATVTLELAATGFLVGGHVRFPDEAAAATAHDLIARLRDELLGDRFTAFALGRIGVLNAIKNLSIHRTGRRLAIETSISTRDARELLAVVATLVETYFTRAGSPPP